MAGAATYPYDPIPQSARSEIADQLSQVLASPWFRSSSRCCQLLRHAVETTIHGHTERLKERQIAIEVFHRKPTYDNTTDPVVRTAAGEVRKRLAQYYSAAENVGQIRIELPIGSYVPVFHFPDPPMLASEVATLSDPPRTSDPEREAARAVVDLPREIRTGSHRWLRWVWLGAVGAGIALAAAAAIWRAYTPAPQVSGFDAFWAPVLSSPNSLLISVGELRARELSFQPDKQRSAVSEQFEIAIPRRAGGGIAVERIGYVEAAAMVARVLGARHKGFEVLDQADTTFADLAGRPMILIGSYDNDWSMGLTGGRRFEFQADYGRGLKWISDRQNPGKEIGLLPTSSPEPSSYDAYAIVMRDTGTVSRQPRVLVGGVGDKGTVAAAEFISDPKYLNQFAAQAPKGWAKKDLEILLQTRIIENNPGIPVVVGYSSW